MKKIIPICILMLLSLNICWAQSDSENPKDTVYRFVEQMAQYPGGIEALHMFLARTVEYPEPARVNNIQGTVLVEFIVETDGSVSNVKVKIPVHPTLDSAAVRAVRQLPNWKPALNQGVPERCYYQVPISFRMSGKVSQERPMTKKEAKQAAKLEKKLKK